MKGIVVTAENTISILDFKEPVIYAVGVTVGGTPETVWPRRLAVPYIIIVNGEGRLNGLRLNIFGSYLYATDQNGNPIVGDIVILKEKRTLNGSDWSGLQEKDVIKLTAQINDILDILQSRRPPLKAERTKSQEFERY